jgi:3-dehydroquinate dehydratase
MASNVDPQIIDVINQVQKATMAPQVVLTSGAGKAYQSVAQSAAIAIQDATDALRNVSTIATTASGVAMAQLLATGEPKYIEALATAQNMMKSATEDFAQIGATASTILKNFPSG